jgi:hypothetical protein
LRSATSVPGFTGSHRSAVRAVAVSRGSTTMSRAPASRAAQIHLVKMGKHSAVFDPTMRMHLASARSVMGSGDRSSPNAFAYAAPADDMQRRPL